MFVNIGRDEESDKYGCDGRVTFDIMFEELHHYFMTLEHGANNSDGIVHSGITQLGPPHNPISIQVIKNLPQLDG